MDVGSAEGIVLFHLPSCELCEGSACWCDGCGLDELEICVHAEDERRPAWRWMLTGGLLCYGDNRVTCIGSINESLSSALYATRVLSGGEQFFEVRICLASPRTVAVGVCSITNGVPFLEQIEDLGGDETSWCLSSDGYIHHNGHRRRVTGPFTGHTSVCVCISTWCSRLDFFKNSSLVFSTTLAGAGRCFRPAVVSSAKRATIQTSQAVEVKDSRVSLQYLCCDALRKARPSASDIFEGLPVSPAVARSLHLEYGWLTRLARASNDAMR